jgi:hypothetical protein
MSKIFPIAHLVSAIVAEEPNPLPPKWKALYMTLLIDIYANHREHTPVVYPQKVVRYNWSQKKSKVGKDGKEVFDDTDKYFRNEDETLRDVLVKEWAGDGKNPDQPRQGLKHPGPADSYDEPGRIATLCALGSPMFSSTSPLTTTDGDEPSKVWDSLKRYLLNTVRIVANNTKATPLSDCFSTQWAPLTWPALRLTELLVRIGLLCGEDSEDIATMPVQAEARAALEVALTESSKKEDKFAPWQLAKQHATVTAVMTAVQIKPNVINYKLEALHTYNRILVLLGTLSNNRRTTRVTNFFHLILAKTSEIKVKKIKEIKKLAASEDKLSEKQLLDRKACGQSIDDQSMMHTAIATQLSNPAVVKGKLISKHDWEKWGLGARLAQLVFERVEEEGSDFKLPTARALLALLCSENKELTGQGLTLLNRLYSQRKRLKSQIDNITIVTANEAKKLLYVNNELNVYFTPAIDRAFGALYEESLDVALDYVSVCSGILRRWSSSININVNDTLNVPGLTTMMDECDEYFGDTKSTQRYPVEQPVENKTDNFPPLFPIEMAKRAMCETVVAHEVFTKLVALAGLYASKNIQTWMVVDRRMEDGRISRFFGLDDTWPEGWRGNDLYPANKDRSYRDPREPEDTGLDPLGQPYASQPKCKEYEKYKDDVNLLTCETLKEYVTESLLLLELYVDINKDNQAEIRDFVLEATGSDPKSHLSLFFMYAIDKMALGPQISRFYSSLFRSNRKAAGSLKLRRNIVLVRLLETVAVESHTHLTSESTIINYCPRHLSFFIDLLLTVATDAAASLTHQLAIYKIVFPDKKQQDLLKKKATKEDKEYIEPISTHYKCAEHTQLLGEFAAYSVELEAERTKLQSEEINRDHPDYGNRLCSVNKDWYESWDSSIIGYKRKQLLFYDRILDLAGNLVRGSSPAVQKIEQEVQKWLGKSEGIQADKEDASTVLWKFVNMDVSFNIMAFKGPALTFLKEAYLDTSDFRERLQQLRDKHNMTKAMLGAQPDENGEDNDGEGGGKGEPDNVPELEDDDGLRVEEIEETDELQGKFVTLMQDFAEQMCNFANDFGEGYVVCKQETDKENNTKKVKKSDENAGATSKKGAAKKGISTTKNVVREVALKQSGGGQFVGDELVGSIYKKLNEDQPSGAETSSGKEKKKRYLLGKTMSEKPGFTQMHRDGEAVYVFSYVIPFMLKYFGIMTLGEDEDESNADAGGQDEAHDDEEEGLNTDEDHKRWLRHLPLNLRSTFNPSSSAWVKGKPSAFDHHENIDKRRETRQDPKHMCPFTKKKKPISEDFCHAVLKLHKMKITDFVGWKTAPVRKQYAANVQKLVEAIPGINDEDDQRQSNMEVKSFLKTANAFAKGKGGDKIGIANEQEQLTLADWEKDPKQLTVKWDAFVHILGSFDRDLVQSELDDDEEMETTAETMTLEESQLVDVLRITAESAMGERVITDTGGNTVQTFEQGFNRAEAVAIFNRLTTYLSIDSQLEEDSELDQGVFFNQSQATNILGELLRTQTWDRDYNLDIDGYSKLENELDSGSAGRVEQIQELLGIKVPGVELVVHHLSMAHDEAVLSYPLKLELLSTTTKFANLLLNNCSRLVQNKVLESVTRANTMGKVEQHFLSGLCGLLDHHVSQFIGSMDSDETTFDERAILTSSTTQILILLQALCDGQNKAMQNFFREQSGFEEQVNVILRVVDALALLFRKFSNSYIKQSKKYADDDALYFNFNGDQLQKMGATASRAFKTHHRKMIKWMNFNKYDVDKQASLLLIMTHCYHTLSDIFEGPNRAVLATVQATRIGVISRQLLEYLGSRMLPSSKFASIGFDGSGSDDNKEFTVVSRALKAKLNMAQAPGLKAEVKAVLSPMPLAPVWLDDPVTYVAIHYGRERLISRATKALKELDVLALEAMRDVCEAVFILEKQSKKTTGSKKAGGKKSFSWPPGTASSWKDEVVSLTYFHLQSNMATNELIESATNTTVEKLTERIKAASSKSAVEVSSGQVDDDEEKDEAPSIEIQSKYKVITVTIDVQDESQKEIPEGYATVRYTVDGSDPDLESDTTFVYEEGTKGFDLGKVKDVNLSKTTVVKARYFAPEKKMDGDVNLPTFEKEGVNWMTVENPLAGGEDDPTGTAVVSEEAGEMIKRSSFHSAKAPSTIGAATHSPMVEAIQGGTTAAKLRESILRAVVQLIEEAEAELHKEFADWHKKVGGRARLDPLIKGFAKAEASVLDMVHRQPRPRSHTISETSKIACHPTHP